MSEERLQKVLARAGVASRRAAEALILDGRVKIDGRVVRELGVKVDPRMTRVDVDGRRIVSEQLVYLVLHKPRAVMCTLSDPEGRTTVADLLRGAGARVVPVGRLDYHTSGAILCTNDGDFAQRLVHPSGGVPKEYVAKVRGVADDAALERWKESIEIEGRATKPAEVRLLRIEGDKSWLMIVLREGRNRQVRRLGDATGFPVLRLARTAQAGITTEGLRPGQWRHLTREELVELKQAYGVPKSVRTAAAPKETEGRGQRKPARKAAPKPRANPARTASAATRGSPSRSGGSPSRSGSSPSRSGSSPSRSGGSPSRTGGSPSRTGGSPSRTGGSPSRTGSSPSRTGGASTGARGSARPTRARRG
jgi:23S rRNA pseudouridine2605 synthase